MDEPRPGTPVLLESPSLLYDFTPVDGVDEWEKVERHPVFSLPVPFERLEAYFALRPFYHIKQSTQNAWNQMKPRVSGKSEAEVVPILQQMVGKLGFCRRSFRKKQRTQGPLGLGFGCWKQ